MLISRTASVRTNEVRKQKKKGKKNQSNAAPEGSISQRDNFLNLNSDFRYRSILGLVCIVISYNVMLSLNSHHLIDNNKMRAEPAYVVTGVMSMHHFPS